MRIGLKEHYGIDDFKTMVVNELTTMDGFDLLLTEEVLEEGAFDIIKRVRTGQKKLVQKLGTSFKRNQESNGQCKESIKENCKHG